MYNNAPRLNINIPAQVGDSGNGSADIPRCYDSDADYSEDEKLPGSTEKDWGKCVFDYGGESDTERVRNLEIGDTEKGPIRIDFAPFLEEHYHLHMDRKLDIVSIGLEDNAKNTMRRRMEAVSRMMQDIPGCGELPRSQSANVKVRGADIILRNIERWGSWRKL